MAQPLRTADSLIFGVRARDTTSQVPRFRWSVTERNYITAHVMAHQSPPAKYNDLDVLLRDLDLHGYEAVTNSEGANVHDMIVRKVKSEILKLRSELNLPNKVGGALRAPSRQPSQQYPLPPHLLPVIQPPALPPMSFPEPAVNPESDGEIDLLKYHRQG